MTTQERLAKVEQNQEDQAKRIEEVVNYVKSVDDKLDILNSKFDELTGAKKALLKLTTIAIGIATVAVAFFNTLKDK